MLFQRFMLQRITQGKAFFAVQFLRKNGDQIMNEDDPCLSVVVPFYRGEAMFSELYLRLCAVFSLMEKTYELIFVNDASPDQGEKIITECAAKDKRCKLISFSRNFGQHYAIMAGLKIARGEWIIVMDCDLQDRPEEIPSLFEKAQHGYDIVFAHRTARKDPLIKKLESAAFYFIFNLLNMFAQILDGEIEFITDKNQACSEDINATVSGFR